MRQVFVDKSAAVIKQVSQPYLDDHSILVLVHYSCVTSAQEITGLMQAKRPVVFGNIRHKVRKVLESIASYGIERTIATQPTESVTGYAYSGVVIAVGKKVRTLRTGDFVACAGARLAQHADVVCVSENLSVKVNKQEHIKFASLTTVGATALQAIRRAQVQLGDTVCVLGLDLVGQLMVQLAQLSGCKVIAVDTHNERVQLARDLGANVAYNSTETDVLKEIEYFTGHAGVDVTLVTPNNSNDFMHQALSATRKKGTVVVVADAGFGVEYEQSLHKEIDILVACSYGPDRFDDACDHTDDAYSVAQVRWTENKNMRAFVDLLERDQLKIAPLVCAQLPINDLAHAPQLFNSSASLALLIHYTDERELAKQQAVFDRTARFVPATKDAMRVGIVGAGAFAQKTLMPLIWQMPQAHINVVVDAQMSNAVEVSQRYGASRALANDEQLFHEDLVDVVVIASPHKYHCDQALRALQHGKAVFMEKPMVTDFEQLERLSNYLNQHPQAPLCVDYNRSFAPVIQKIKEAVSHRSSPLMIHYRMNVGFIPREHWIRIDHGSGRIIGDACHIVDLFCFLTGSKPVAVSVEALHTQDPSLFPTDNVAVQIGFADGSICSLLYTALGHAGLGKERMELFFDSKSIIMDDYEYLAGFGLSKAFDEMSHQPDKGHGILLNSFFDSIKKGTGKAPIAFERLYDVAYLTLIIDQLACAGGGTREVTL